MQYTTKDEILKLGDIDPEMAAVSSCNISWTCSASSGRYRSSRSSICHQWTIRISMNSERWPRNAKRQTTRHSVPLHRISSRQTTKSRYTTAQQFGLESTSQYRLQKVEARSLLCKRPPLLDGTQRFPTPRPRIRMLTVGTKQVPRRRILHWIARGRRAKLSKFRPSSRSRVH